MLQLHTKSTHAAIKVEISSTRTHSAYESKRIINSIEDYEQRMHLAQMLISSKQVDAEFCTIETTGASIAVAC